MINLLICHKPLFVPKKNLSERDICTKYITPAIEVGGWDIKRQVREEVSFTDGDHRLRTTMYRVKTAERYSFGFL